MDSCLRRNDRNERWISHIRSTHVVWVSDVARMYGAGSLSTADCYDYALLLRIQAGVARRGALLDSDVEEAAGADAGARGAEGRSRGDGFEAEA